jgi:hypothetical protein
MSGASDRSLRSGALLACWVLISAAFVARSMLFGGSKPFFLDADDAMRLVTVHDLLAGQGWYDTLQHRINTPHGAELHWSRLIDLPLAGILLLLRPLFGASADLVLGYVWPLFLLLPSLWLGARIALRLGGPTALVPGLLLPAFSVVTLFEFAPGRLDHHNVQILLAQCMLLACLAALRAPRAAILAAIAAALSLCIGIEGLPVTAATILALGLAWVTDRRHASALRLFGLAFPAALALALVQAQPPDRWFVPVTDILSIVHLAAGLLCAAAFLIITRPPLLTWQSRLAAGVVAGATVLAVLAAFFPAILASPYAALDEWLQTNWIARISEAESWLVNFLGEPAYATGVLVPVLTALVVALVRATRPGEERPAWFTYALFVAVALLLMLFQIRAARIALPLAIPGCAVMVGAAWHRMVNSRGFGPILATLGAAIISASIAVIVLATAIILAFPDYAAATTDTTLEARNACLSQPAFAGLAARPPTRLMAPVDLGSQLLLYTPHSVVGAPYHRNGDGVRDTFRFFNEPLEESRSILAARGITLVVVCPALKEIIGLVDYTPDSFVALYAEGRLPAWLHDETPPGSPLRIYSVEP